MFPLRSMTFLALSLLSLQADERHCWLSQLFNESHLTGAGLGLKMRYSLSSPNQTFVDSVFGKYRTPKTSNVNKSTRSRRSTVVNIKISSLIVVLIAPHQQRAMFNLLKSSPVFTTAVFRV